MTRCLLVSHDAGGTIPPMLAVAQALVARGHAVTWLGQLSIAARAERAGCRFVAFTSLPSYATDQPLEAQLGLTVAAIAGCEVGDDTLAVVEHDRIDVAVVDANLAGAAAAVESVGLPSALLLHSMYATFVDTWFGDLWPLLADGINATRRRFGLDACDSWPNVFGRHDLLVSVVPSSLDAPTSSPPPLSLRQFGFLVPAIVDVSASVPLAPGAEPAVLVSLSTTYQEHESLLQRIVDGVGRCDVRALVTTGGVPVGKLRVPPNVTVVEHVDHGLVLPHVDTVVTHAGLGTVAAALQHGVPLVCTPISRDQPLNASRVAELGAGIVLDAAASAGEFAAGVERVLGEPSYRSAAQSLAKASRAAGGAEAVADALEALAP